MSLAYLIMDDGGWISGSKSVRIATNNFTLQEVQLFRDIFKLISIFIVQLSYFKNVKEIVLQTNTLFTSFTQIKRIS